MNILLHQTCSNNLAAAVPLFPYTLGLKKPGFGCSLKGKLGSHSLICCTLVQAKVALSLYSVSFWSRTLICSGGWGWWWRARWAGVVWSGACGVGIELQCVNSAGTILLFLSFKQDYLHTSHICTIEGLAWLPSQNPSTSIWVPTKKKYFFCLILLQFSCSYSLFQLFAQKVLKKQMSTKLDVDHHLKWGWRYLRLLGDSMRIGGHWVS